MRARIVNLIVLCLLALSTSAFAALTSFVTMTNGYLYDSATAKAWAPKGIAYQTWNRPLGVWQTQDQIKYDLDEMVKMGVDSIRIDMVWQHIEETGDDQWSWANYDFLFQECDKRNIRAFALIGYQWPPSWFPDAWYTMHPPGYDSLGIYHTNRWQSDIINYENPSARAQYSNFIYQVTRRYKDTKAVAGWIVGNEYGYLGLWSLKYDGYDTNCEAAFRTWCTTKYTSITNLNATWSTAYTNFSQIVLVDEYSWKGTKGAEWADMVQWHEDSIANFTAAGARAARAGDTNHLLSYATVGMQWGEEDWRYHSEDRGKIAQACASNNAPLGFFSVNNYPWALDGSETRNGRWGVFFTKKVTGIPVLYSETGFTSTETLFPGVDEARQGLLIRNSMWEGMEAGAIGMHVFTWQDRPWISDREKGFGILYGNRAIKPAFWTCRDAYTLMGQTRLNELLSGSKDRKPDIAFLWTAANDSQYNRYENEMQHEAGALERLGYEPNYINLNELAAGAYTNFKVIILPRNMRVDSAVPGYTNSVLNFLLKNVVVAGVHVLAVADLPGEQDFYGWYRPAFTNELRELFGIDVSDLGGFQPKGTMSDSVLYGYYNTIDVRYNTNGPASVANYAYSPGVWKYNDRVRVADGTLWATMNDRKNRGFESSNASLVNWGTWGTTEIDNWFPYEGTNMLRMWGASGAWQNNNDVIPGERYSARAYLRNNSDDPLRGGAYGQVSLEWYTTNDVFISSISSAKLTGPTPGNSWVEYKVDGLAPTNASYCRTILKTDADAAPQLLLNASLSGSGDAPTNWSQWNTANHDADTGTYRSSPNSWNFWYDGGIYQDVAASNGFVGGDTLVFGGYLYTPSADALRNGTKYGIIQMECWNGGSLLTTYSASPIINSNSAKDSWVYSSATGAVPTNATSVRVVVRCNDYASGDGTFRADDISLTKQGASGSCYFDGDTWVPAVVAKSQGAAKAVIVLHSLDIYTDTDGDGQPNVEPYKWRSDVLGSIIKDYFGVQPTISVSGTNAYMCLPEYRTCADTSTLWQIKSYAYDWHVTGGGNSQPFTITSSLLNGKAVRAFMQGQILTTNCNGTLTLTLPPDGMEMLYVYTPTTNRQEVVQITDAPSEMHPLGSGGFTTKVRYDCLTNASLNLKVAFMEKGDNGDGVTNEIYAILTNTVTGAGEATNMIWIPNYNQNHPDYISSSEGGKYQFAAWLENAGGAHVVDAVPRDTLLDWGVRPTTNMPATINKGDSLSMPFKWENLYEYYAWQNTPMTRNSSYPGRVAVYRSSKTEAQYPGHWAKANAVCDWLESMGYSAGNPLDILFDNVVVSNLFSDNFNTASLANWTRVAGSGNWTADKCTVDWGSGLIYDKYTTFPLTNAAWQVSFKVTADATKTVDKVYLYLSKAAGASPTYSLGLYADAGGFPTGSALSSVNFSVVTSAYHWLAIDLPNYQWTAGQTYHLVMKYVSGTIGSTNGATIEYAGPDTPGRKVLTSTNNGAAWTATTFEPTFRVLYTDTNSFAQPYVTAAAYGFTGSTNYGQLFTTPYPMTVTNISVRMYKQSTVSGDIQLNVRKWSDKSLVVSSTVTRASIATTNSWVKFNFASAVSLAGGTQYYYELKSLGTTGLYYVSRGNTLSGYGAFSWGLTNDCQLFTTNSGTTWLSYGDYDLGFILGTTLGDGYSFRASRIGNSDNVMVAGGMWTNYSVSTDIKYKKQDNYFSDAEILFRYQNRSNYYKVAIEDYYGFWEIKYVVNVGGSIQQQGWLYTFSKTNRPVENTWYNLRVDAVGSTNNVYLNGQLVGTFWATNFATGKIGLSTRASQLGIWEPQKGYFFIDDDEYNTSGGMLNMDWGYLKQFYTTLVLPGVYVMNDSEAGNLVAYIYNGMFSIFSTDGSVAMKDEAGNLDMGRVEGAFGVGTTTISATNISKLAIGSAGHYVTLDYAAGSQLSVTGNAKAWTTLTTGKALATATNSSSIPALIVNTIATDPQAPGKVFAFNFDADTAGQLTNSLKQIAQRAFEWSRGQASKVTMELRYDTQSTNAYDFVILSVTGWVLNGSGTSTLIVNIPTNGIMTGDNLYWSYYTYPWDSTDPWGTHTGFYSAKDDLPGGAYTSLGGIGLQILGITDYAYAGRDWDKWIAFNTRTQQLVMTFGIKDKGLIADEDNFDDGDYNGWSITANTNIAWTVTNGALRATVVSTGGYSYITRNGWGLNNTNITIEYDTRFMNGAKDGGLVYRGRVLYVSPNRCGWDDMSPSFVTTTNLQTGAWNHIIVNIRDGSPYEASDLYVNMAPVYRNEPIQSTNWTTNTVGFLSPYSNANSYAEWDNFRLEDEQYATVYENQNGITYPTNNVPTATWPSIPDYDPAMWEHAGTLAGAQYEWYIYFRGKGVSAQKDVRVYFAPRLMMEATNFPTYFQRGTTVSVPIEWEDIFTNVPAKMKVSLEEPYLGLTNVGSKVFDVTNAVSSGAYYSITVSNSAPSSSNYLWVAYIYPPFATNPMLQRIGLDDTFRFTPEPFGAPVNPETRVTVYSEDQIFVDAGIPLGANIYVWAGLWTNTGFDAHCTNVAGIPEGSECFCTTSSAWAGWGVFKSGVDMSYYSNGYLKFWLKSDQALKVELEGPQYTKSTIYVSSTTNTWKEYSLSIATNFPTVVLTNMFGLFEITADGATTNYVDNVRWSGLP